MYMSILKKYFIQLTDVNNFTTATKCLQPFTATALCAVCATSHLHNVTALLAAWSVQLLDKKESSSLLKVGLLFTTLTLGYRIQLTYVIYSDFKSVQSSQKPAYSLQSLQPQSTIEALLSLCLLMPALHGAGVGEFGEFFVSRRND